MFRPKDTAGSSLTNNPSQPRLDSVLSEMTRHRLVYGGDSGRGVPN